MAEPVLLGAPLAAGLLPLAAGAPRTRRRRRALNAALHELRRPLQVLALRPEWAGDPQFELAIEAVALIDREVNGGSAPPAVVADAADLARLAVERWRGYAASQGRTIALSWRAGPCPLRCEPVAVSRAIDNLIANALEHGAGQIRLEGTRFGRRVRVHVADSGPPIKPAGSHRSRPDPRRGHGTDVVAEVARSHGGRFAACDDSAGTVAVLELPLLR
jgi:signal transduction histidine kinase